MRSAQQIGSWPRFCERRRMRKTALLDTLHRRRPLHEEHRMTTHRGWKGLGRDRRLLAAGGLSLILLRFPITPAFAGPLTIFEIQFTDDAMGRSSHEGEVIDCVGGIVVSKFRGTRPRVILQDPGAPAGWGGIQVKDWTMTHLFDHVELGDWVEVTNVLVEEFYGTTILQWQSTYNPGFRVISRGNPLPPPILVPVANIPAPLERPYDEWWVDSHDAEQHESSRMIVRDVTVTRMMLGAHNDNYNLQTPAGYDCWAADYMNEDRSSSGYHSFVTTDQHFCAVVGIFEQYTIIVPEWEHWDYYQLITLETASLAMCGDGDGDGGVGLADWPRFWECVTGPVCDSGVCNPPAWTVAPLEADVERCLMMDQDYDGDVDLRDAAEFHVRCGGV